MTIGTWLALGEFGWVIGLGTWIVLERRSPAATLAWIFGLAWIPLLGIPVYLLIGPRRLRRKKLRYRRGKTRIAEASESLERERGEAADSPAEWNSPLALLAQRAGQPRPQSAKRINLLTSGNACYESIEAAIASAEHHVHLEYYIWEPGRIGARFRDLLCEKARSGVEVRLLIDAVGSRRLNRRFLRPLHDSGAELARFNPITIMRYPPGLVNFRTHRKLCVVDGEIGFLGGVNICDSHSEAISGELAWRDTHLRIEGQPVGEMQLAFLEDWQFANGGGPCSSDYFPLSKPPNAGPRVQILTSGPDHESYAIERFFFGAIVGARKRILLTTPYFVPNEGILSALTTSAMRGVEVRILVPKRSDSRLVTAAARSYFEDLARRGVMIHEYGPRMLHAKTMVVDDDVSIVGTANMDNRSFRLNFEIAAVIYDRELADSLSANFAEDLQHASEYRVRDARRTPFAQRLGESAARLLSPLL